MLGGGQHFAYCTRQGWDHFCRNWPVQMATPTEVVMTKSINKTAIHNNPRLGEEIEVVKIVMGFARDAARAFGAILDADDVAQEVAMQVLVRVRNDDEVEFGRDGRTRVYVKKAVYWLATKAWRKHKRQREAQATPCDELGELLPARLSRAFERTLAGLTPAKRDLLFRIAVDEEPLVELADQLARARAVKAAEPWEALSEVQQTQRRATAYNALHHQYARVRADLRDELLRACG
jgi:DNA-directed RNA polymerase specialized sigma24 family protein